MNAEKDIDTKLNRIALISASIPFIISVIALTGHITNHTILASFGANFKPMPIDIVLINIILSGVLFVYFYKALVNPWLITFCKLILVIIFCLSMMVLIDDLSGLPLNLEQYSQAIHWGSGKWPDSRISLLVLFMLLLKTITLLIFFSSNKDSTISKKITATFALMVLTLSLMTLLGYLYNAPLFMYIGGGQLTTTAIPAALSSLAVSISLIAINGKDSLPLRPFIGPSLYSQLMRTIVPMFVILIIIQNLINLIVLPLQTEFAITTSLVTIIIITLTGVLLSKITSAISHKINTLQSEAANYASALERSNEELQQFAYIASHDLQEPLRVITSYLQLIERRYKNKLDQDANDFIEFAVNGATRLQEMINDLLIYSRVKTKAMPLTLVNTINVVKQAIENLQLTIDESKASITMDALPAVMADEPQLTMVFQNLLGNALKFHKPGEAPTIHITAEEKPAEWVFSVADQGIGIDPSYYDKLFIIFKRLVGKEYSGSGIGLAVCKRIVERHKGRIWVNSELGKGATFYFTIPK